MALNAYDLFEGIVYCKGTSCARRIHLSGRLHEWLSPRPYELASLRDALDELTDKWSITRVMDAEAAQRRLAIQELTDVIDYVTEGGPCTDRVLSFRAELEQLQLTSAGIVDYYRGLGLTELELEIFVVSKLPAPYDDRDYAVLTADLGDRKRHGIVPGVYFLEHKLHPIISEYLLAHEAVHSFLGGVSPDESCYMFEEGLADYLSIFGYLRSEGSADLARNVYRLYRLSSACGLIWDSYVDGARQVLDCVLEVGIDGVLDAARRGRLALEKLSLFQQRSEGKVREWEGDQLARELLLQFPRSTVVSAEAFLAAKVLDDGLTLVEASERAGMDLELFRTAVEELSSRALVTMRRDGLVVSRALCRHYLARNSLRYDFR